jgi:hypothetical protein
MTVAQVQLRSGSTVRTCWVEDRVRAGNRITLKTSEEPGRFWDVVSVGSQRRELAGIPRGWNNNI